MTKRAAALFRPVSDDRKLAPVAMVANTTERLRPVAQGPFCSSTYVSIAATCPDTCEFKDGGCYAMAGFTGNALRRMDREAHRESLSADDVIAIECELIEGSFRTGRGPIARVPQDGARGGRDLRLHVGGDVSSEEGARMLGAAAYRWRLRGGGVGLDLHASVGRHRPRCLGVVHLGARVGREHRVRAPRPKTWVRARARRRQVRERQGAHAARGQALSQGDSVPGTDARHDLRRVPAVPRSRPAHDERGDRVLGARRRSSESSAPAAGAQSDGGVSR